MSRQASNARTAARSGAPIVSGSQAAKSKPGNPENGPLPCTNCGQLRSVCRCDRDALIGSVIQASAVYIMRDPIKVTGHNYLATDPNVVGAPQTLHVHPFHGGTEGVGLAFSTLMLRYLSAAMRELGTRDRRDLSEWWESDYGIRRVHAGLQEMYPPLRARQILTMVLACANEDATPTEVAREYNQSLPWLARIIVKCQWLADKPASTPIIRYRAA